VTPTLLGVNPSISATDVKSLIALLKANPGKYTYGSSGIGSILHLCGEQFKTLAGGLDVVHVPYRGSAPLMSDLVGGQISMAFDATPTALPQALSGAIRPLGAGMAERLRALPDLPTLQEQGAKGVRVLHLERDPCAGEHAAVVRRAPQQGDERSARHSRGVQAPARGRR
jgi:tripartite-type tricarboxylate transporter receptor subunit TctC